MKILIAGISTRALAESAVRGSLGYEILTVDYFGDSDQKALCYNLSLKRDFGKPFSTSALFEICRSLPFDALVYTSSFENHPGLLRRLSQGRLLLGNQPATLLQVRNPSIFFPFLAEKGIPFPRTLWRGEAPPWSGPFLKKPIQSGGGHRITLHLTPPRLGKGMILQEYLPGLPASAAFVADGSNFVLLGLSEQLIGDPAFGARGFRYSGSLLGPLPGVEEVLSKLEEILSLLTREFHLIGVNGLDFILKEGEVYPLEINPRYTASMELVEWGYGLSIFDLHVEACLGKLPTFDLRAVLPKAFFGKAVLFATEDLTVPKTEGWKERGIKDLPFPGELIRRGRPICTVFAKGQDREACYRALVEAAQALPVSPATSSR